MNPTCSLPEYQFQFDVNSIEGEQRNLLDLQITCALTKQFLNCLPQSSIKKANKMSIVRKIQFKSNEHAGYESIRAKFPLLLSINKMALYNIKIVLKESFDKNITFKFSLRSTNKCTISTKCTNTFDINNDNKLNIIDLNQEKKNEFIFTLQFIPMDHWDCIYHKFGICTEYFSYKTAPFMLIK